ncbi:MAG: hypothetical protein ACUVR3_11090, partial [Candidatus Roseilinea sp.]|uniref:hypothetical protein n=1 Tax=Candidatus Roseilinea sp. TaxID=2838777 RepID=UPI00404AAAE9
MAYNAARALSGSEIAGGGIWNSGTANLNNARVERNQADGTALAGWVSYVSASGNGWSCSFSAPTVTCTAATLSVGA